MLHATRYHISGQSPHTGFTISVYRLTLNGGNVHHGWLKANKVRVIQKQSKGLQQLHKKAFYIMRIDNKATFVNSDDHKSKSDNNSSSQLLHRGIKIDFMCVSVSWSHSGLQSDQNNKLKNSRSNCITAINNKHLLIRLKFTAHWFPVQPVKDLTWTAIQFDVTLNNNLMGRASSSTALNHSLHAAQVEFFWSSLAPLRFSVAGIHFLKVLCCYPWLYPFHSSIDLLDLP